MEAAWHGHFDAVDELIRAGANLEVETRRGLHGDRLTAFMYAVGRGNLEIVKKLVESGANHWDKKRGETALHIAAQLDYLHLVNYLIALGHDVNASGQH